MTETLTFCQPCLGYLHRDYQIARIIDARGRKDAEVVSVLHSLAAVPAFGRSITGVLLVCYKLKAMRR